MNEKMKERKKGRTKGRKKRKERNKARKWKGMTAPRYGGGGDLLSTRERSQPEVETSRRVQSERDPETGYARRGETREETTRGGLGQETGIAKMAEL